MATVRSPVSTPPTDALKDAFAKVTATSRSVGRDSSLISRSRADAHHGTATEGDPRNDSAKPPAVATEQFRAWTSLTPNV